MLNVVNIYLLGRASEFKVPDKAVIFYLNAQLEQLSIKLGSGIALGCIS